MSEHVLLLADATEQSKKLEKSLFEFGVDSIAWLHPQPEILGALSRVLRAVNIVIIADTFCGSSRETAKLVRQLRKMYFDPMILYSPFATNDGSFPCQVAGCNFVVKDVWDTDQIIDRIRTLIMEISPELDRDRQPRSPIVNSE